MQPQNISPQFMGSTFKSTLTDLGSILRQQNILHEQCPQIYDHIITAPKYSQDHQSSMPSAAGF